MITEDYVSFETAKFLKEKGFDGQCATKYDSNGCIWDNIRYDGIFLGNNDIFPEEYLSPTLQMAMKWLREEHAIIIELHHQYRKEWYAIVSSENPLGIGVYTTSTFNTYEEACEAAIKYCLKNLI